MKGVGTTCICENALLRGRGNTVLVKKQTSKRMSKRQRTCSAIVTAWTIAPAGVTSFNFITAESVGMTQPLPAFALVTVCTNGPPGCMPQEGR